MDLTDTTEKLLCVWKCVRQTIIGLPIKLTMWGEIYREFLDAFNDPASNIDADPHFIVPRATLGCIALCNLTMTLRLSQTLRSYEIFGAPTALPGAEPTDFYCDPQGFCIFYEWA